MTDPILTTEPETLTRGEAWLREHRGHPAPYFETVEIRECLACLHNFEPENGRETACPWCGGPSMAEPPVVLLHQIEPLPVHEGTGQTPQKGQECPHCEGRGGNGAYDPQWYVDCSTCEGEGHLSPGTAEQARVGFCKCAHCGGPVEPADGDLVGVADPEGGEYALVCTDCLADPEAVNAAIGVIRFEANRRHTVRPEPVLPDHIRIVHFPGESQAYYQWQAWDYSEGRAPRFTGSGGSSRGAAARSFLRGCGID